MGIPPVYPCPYCGYNFMLCAHGPNHAAALSEGISRLSLEAIGQQGSMGKMGLNPGAKEFVPRFVTPPVHVPPPPQPGAVSEVARGGEASSTRVSAEGMGDASLGARPKVRQQKLSETRNVPQSLVCKALNLPEAQRDSREEAIQFFSTDCGNIEEVILSAIRSASKSISVKIYSLSSESILHALRKRSDEGLFVRVHYQNLQDNRGILTGASNMHLKRSKKTQSFQHKKEIIVDDRLAILGTMNFSTLSLLGDANCLIKIRSLDLCYLMNRNYTGTCYVQGQEVFYQSLYRTGPDGSEEIIKAIDSAQREIWAAVYMISQTSILEALDRAHRRGVEVIVIVDSSQRQEAFSGLQKLNSSVRLLECWKCGCLHCKMCIIDKKNLIIGSVNWTKRGFAGNIENILIVSNMTPIQRAGVINFWKYVLSYSHEVTPENIGLKRKRLYLNGMTGEED